MASFRLFVVYHKQLHPGVYEGLSDDNIARLTFYKVNEAIPFEFGLRRSRPLALAKEYELPYYEPAYQAAAFNEVSCMVHVLRNGLHQGVGYVGVIQYDMLVDDASLARWEGHMDAGARIIAPAAFGPLPPELLEAAYIREAPFYGFPMAFVSTHLCEHFGVSREELAGRIERRHAEGAQIALTNAFLLRVDLFQELAAWLERLSPALLAYTRANPSHLNHHGHMGGIAERAIALYFLFRLEEGEQIAPMRLRHVRIRELHRSRFGQK